MTKKKRLEKKGKRARVENFITKNKGILNIRGIERKLDIPKGSIQKYLSNHDSIKYDRIKQIDSLILSMIAEYDKYL